VGDAPLQSADFSRIIDFTALNQICEHVANVWRIPVRLVDFRLSSIGLDDSHRIIRAGSLEGDSRGYCRVNLGERSLLTPFSAQCTLFRVTNYDCSEMRKHHNETIHEYLIPRTVLDADVIINLPKLKTHRKAGLTAALKNIVGINAHKDWLPHHRSGSRLEGGDEYNKPCFAKKVASYFIERIDRNPYSRMNSMNRLAVRLAGGVARRLAPDPFVEGSWYGNDTIWRTVLDLNRLLVFADRGGVITEVPQRQCLTIVDAIVGGEAEGPLEPDERPCGMIVGGVNPVAVDAALATMIGFDFRKIPLIAHGFQLKDLSLANFGPEDIEICSQDSRWDQLRVGEPCPNLRFLPPSGWRKHIELIE
jgi:hypothetical protein